MSRKNRITALIAFLIAIAVFSQLSFAQDFDEVAIEKQGIQNNAYGNIILGNSVEGLPSSAHATYLKMIDADKAAKRYTEGFGTDTELKIQQIMNDAYAIAKKKDSNSAQVQVKIDEAYAYLGLGLGGGLKITTGSAWWIIIFIMAAIILWFMFAYKKRSPNMLKQKKTNDETLFSKLGKKIKKYSLRLIDLFKGKHLRNQENAMQKILDCCKELHQAAAKEDIYFILEDVMAKYKSRTGREMTDDLGKSVKLLIHEDENVIVLISALEKLNKKQEDIFMKEQFSAILKPSLRNNLNEVFKRIKSVLNEMKTHIATRLYGEERKGEEGLHKLLQDIDEINKIVGHPKGDKNAHKMNQLQQSIVNETKRIKEALEIIQGYISPFEKLFMQEDSLDDMADKELRNRKQLAVDLVDSFNRLSSIIRKAGNRIKEEDMKSNAQLVSRFITTYNDIIADHPEKNHKTAIRLYISYYKDISESIIPDEDVDQIMKLYELLNERRGGETKYVDLKI